MCDHCKNHIAISIHALRGEGDWIFRQKCKTTREFQSTPSVGRATDWKADISVSSGDFNPRPPWGGRLG